MTHLLSPTGSLCLSDIWNFSYSPMFLPKFIWSSRSSFLFSWGRFPSKPTLYFQEVSGGMSDFKLRKTALSTGGIIMHDPYPHRQGWFMLRLSHDKEVSSFLLGREVRRPKVILFRAHFFFSYLSEWVECLVFSSKPVSSPISSHIFDELLTSTNSFSTWPKNQKISLFLL